MIEFLGTPLLQPYLKNQAHTNLSDLCGVSASRTKELIEALMAAKKTAYVKQPTQIFSGMPEINAEQFSLPLLLNNAQIDTDTPAEVMLIGLLIGRLYTEIETQSKTATKRLRKMMNLMEKNPAKAFRKMQKDIFKAKKAE